MLNGAPTQLHKNENGHYRGMHIVIINEKTGKVETARVFDTHESSDEFDDFIVKDLPRGRIVVAACKDDCNTELSYLAK